MKALIDENGIVCQVSETEFGTAPPTFWVDCADDVVAYQYKYENGVVVPLPPPPPPTADENKQRAKTLLENSDWSVLPDVGLANVAEWEAYRLTLRNIVRNPQAGDLNWPTKPQEVWN